MKRFTNILFFADDIKNQCPALQRAIALAKQNRARLTVVDVIEKGELLPGLTQHSSGSLQVALCTRRHAELEHLMAPFQDGQDLFYLQVLRGKPFIEVIRLVQRNHIDLLIKPARLLHGISGPQLHSNDLHLLRKCPCPVWIDKSTEGARYHSILAAVDPLARPDPGTDNKVLELANAMAVRDKAALSIVHAWQLYGESALKNSWIQVTADEYAHTLNKCEQTHRHHLDALLAFYGMDTDMPHVFLNKGEPATVISEVADKTRADLIVLGTVGRSGIPGIIIGNTAEAVVQSTRASILAVKPDDFISPVSLPED